MQIELNRQTLKIGMVVHGDINRTIVGFASWVYPNGSQADRAQKANIAAGYPSYRVLMDDGTSVNVHRGNVLMASNPR